MLLNNYYNLRKASYAAPPSVNLLINPNLQIALSDGTLFTITSAECNGVDRLFRASAGTNLLFTSKPSTSSVNCDIKYIVFGDGDKPVELSDFSVSGNVIKNISCTSISAAYIENGIRYTYTFINRDSAESTIKEVCIFDNFTLSSSTRKVALWREVFDEPLTVGAGESFIYNFEYTQE